MRNEMLKIKMHQDMNYANMRKIDYYTSSIPEILHNFRFKGVLQKWMKGGTSREWKKKCQRNLRINSRKDSTHPRKDSTRRHTVGRSLTRKSLITPSRFEAQPTLKIRRQMPGKQPRSEQEQKIRQKMKIIYCPTHVIVKKRTVHSLLCLLATGD